MESITGFILAAPESSIQLFYYTLLFIQKQEAGSSIGEMTRGDSAQVPFLTPISAGVTFSPFSSILPRPFCLTIF